MGAWLFLAAPMAQAQNLSTYGTPGLIDMPTADVLPDGHFAATSSVFRDTVRNTFVFQMLPRVYGSFRYSYLRDLDGQNGSIYDRSFDIHFLLRKETARGPAIGLGLRDIGGTGIYGSEYVVLTKTFADRWRVTGGMGWGRLAGRNSFSNPLGAIDGRFDTRPNLDFGTGGTLSTSQWFRGPAALFGGVEYKYSEKLSFLAEYSSDVYEVEGEANGFDADFPVNIGVNYKFENGVNLNGYYMYGSTVGFQVSYTHDPRSSVAPGGYDPAAPALKPAEQVALASWNLPEETSDSTGAADVLRVRLDQEGLRLIGYQAGGGRAAIEIENNRYPSAAQSVGRAARAMANVLHPSLDHFAITLSENGVPITKIELARSDLYELENDLEGAWRTLSRATISDDSSGIPSETVPGAFPHFSYRFGPYARLSFFDPDEPLRYELGAEFEASYIPVAGLTFSGKVRQPILNTLDDTVRESNSILPHVRSDWPLYAKESNFQVNTLTGEYLWRPGDDLFARVTAGYLEEMFGGVSAELLWSPNESRLALGGEINYARQRNFDMLFGFQDYDILTGHASLYYDMPGDYFAQIDAGRYLAGDWGATFSLDREFNNGFKIGAFFTLTDVSFEDFGEGSFDKGIKLEIPLSLFNGKSTQTKLTQVIRPILRDGGARLAVANRLYGYTRDERAGRLVGQWGRFYR
ncbi:MAG: YjbH domain-containing protein [Paracoccaceae bacterium]